MDFWPMQGELGSKHWGNRLPGSGGTAGPENQNGFLITESENPFRQAWLGKNECVLESKVSMKHKRVTTENNNIHEIHAPNLRTTSL